jgi:hypothetical protein
MTESLDVYEIARCTGLPVRKIRYVLEHGVLPGTKRASRGRRVTRRFTLFESFGIACAALLLEGGLRRHAVQDCMEVLSSPPRGTHAAREVPLYRALYEAELTCLEVGDGVNVRLIGRSSTGSPGTDWIQAATGEAMASSYIPLIRLSIHVLKLRDTLKQSNPRGLA